MPRRRQIAFANYGQVLGAPPTDPRVRQIAWHAFGNYFKMFADFIIMGSLSREAIRRMVRPEGLEHLETALRQGNGAVAVTAHMSNWDILAAAAAAYGYPVNAVTNDLPSGRLNDVVVKSRARIGMRMIPLQAGSLRNILKALSRNELVALACDLYKGDHGVLVSFFGRPARLPSGPASIALKTGAPIVPVWVRREPDNRYVAHVEPPIPVSQTGDQSEDIRSTTTRIAEFFERIIREAPDQWLVFLPVWRQPDEPTVAAPPMQEPVLDPS
jgi:KDO2-lipid IV(A) lauroyltransferase